ncbi:MAG: RsmB/NOP family class I SAM-dependent RNA methyltransferase [Alphaproteobacteria bacterium]|nr:RsmB/NOP family class I SAM-dependent RNA methyltransferase [Alphaproteobacteria bacterium]
MKIPARIQSTIDLLDAIFGSFEAPADKIMTSFFRERRFIGSGDRRAIAELTYAILRDYFKLTWFHKTDSARLLVIVYLVVIEKKSLNSLESLFVNEIFCPGPLTSTEIKIIRSLKPDSELPLWAEYNVPEDIIPYLEESFPSTFKNELLALNKQAPLDLRINLLKNTREAVLKKLTKDQIEAKPTPLSPIGIRLDKRRPLPDHPLWKDGSIEVQDEGSQLIALLCKAGPGMSVLDYCAGAGGKSLAIAATMQNKGRLVLSDILEWRLKRAQERLKRAGIHNYECRLVTDKTWLKRQEKRFDRVLVDAPCSGTGTWRRNPDLKMKFTKQDLFELLQKQEEILSKASKFVKPNGLLIYATCSLLQAENHQQIKKFLNHHTDFKLIPIGKIWKEIIVSPCPTQDEMLQLSTFHHDTDGFFVSVLERKAFNPQIREDSQIAALDIA